MQDRSMGARVRSLVAGLRDKNLHTWLPGYIRQRLRRTRPSEKGLRHLIFAFCDHYEPLWAGVSHDVGEARVRFWQDNYPRMVDGFRDADGLSPRHSFFYPSDQYDPRLLDRLTSLTRAGHGEVELHLHHDGDSHATLREKLLSGIEVIGRHGHFAREADGRIRYAFIHGDWALANSRSGQHCGVDDEVPLLFETGCYADFTFPSAPEESQPAIINQIYWPDGDLRQARCYENGRQCRVGETLDDRILMIQGPLALVFRHSRVPLRIENGAITANDPGVPSRVATWVAQNIHVQGREDWVFVKIYTHGAPEAQAASLLGDPGRALHRELTTRYNDGVSWRLHYVTAREMYNIAMAAMSGKSGDPNTFRNFCLAPPPSAP
jgi:hypothetical protein